MLRVVAWTLVCGCGRVDFAVIAGDGAGGDGAADAHLIAWYTFDAGLATRTVVDDSGNHHEAECQDTFACPTTVAGHRGLALAASSPAAPGVSADDSASLHLASLSIAAWVSWNDTAGLSSIVAKPVSTATADSYQLDVDQTGTLRFTVGDTTGFARIASQSPLPLNAWIHVAGTYDGASLALYVSGASAATPIAGHAIGYDTQPLLLGTDRNAGTAAEEFEGAIDDVRIYDIALEPAAIAALATN